MSWAAVRVSPEDPTTSSQAWAPTRSGPGLPRPHASTGAPVLLLQVLVVVVIGERSSALELGPNASGVGLVSRPYLCVSVSFASYSWVPDSRNGPNVPIFTGSRGNIVLPKLIDGHASSVLPYMGGQSMPPEAEERKAKMCKVENMSSDLSRYDLEKM